MIGGLNLRNLFPAIVTGNAGVYLDNAAMTQLGTPVAGAMAAFLRDGRANVKRGIYPLAVRATDTFEAARASVARYLGAAQSSEVIFTSGATAAINLAAHAFGATLAPGDEVIVGEGEHHANIVPWQMLRGRAGVVLKVLPVDDQGCPRADALGGLLTDKTRLVAVTHCSNVIGAVTDIAAFADVLKDSPAKLLIDGAQMAAHGPIDVRALGCDFYIVTGHKMFGPTGIGALWGRADILEDLPPFMGGGEMIRRVTFDETTYAPAPHRFEAGTPPVIQAIGLGAAADWLGGIEWPEVRAHEAALCRRMLDGLVGMAGVRVLGPGGKDVRAPIVSFTVEHAHPHDVCHVMGEKGVALRGGHHCAQPLMDRFGVDATTRASIALYNTEGDVDAFLTALGETLKVIR
ncbi:MAG: cysteine desulfurase [Rhodospirillaceae bacterium]